MASPFNQDLVSRARAIQPPPPCFRHCRTQPFKGIAGSQVSPATADAASRVAQAAQTGEQWAALAELEANPLLRHIPDKAAHCRACARSRVAAQAEAKAANFLKAPSRSERPASSGGQALVAIC